MKIRMVIVIMSGFILQSCMTLDFTKHQHSYKPIEPEFKNINVAFVLGGGGAKALAHVGVMEELINAGIQPDLIVGCSAGAVVGGLFANNPDLDHIKNILLHKKREDLLSISLRYLPFGLSNSEELETFLEQELDASKFEGLGLPFISVATNLEFGNLTAFGTGPVVPAIQASAAYPGVFLPVKIEDQYFVDGGVAEPLPVSTAKHFGAKFIIAIDLSGSLTDEFPNHALGIVKRCLEISYKRQSTLTGKGADYIIKVPFTNEGTFDDEMNYQVYELGRQAGRQAIADIKKKLQAKNLG